MPEKILIKGGRLVDPASGTDESTDVLIEGGIVVETGDGLWAADARILSAEGCIVCPGFVDLHTHLRQPGREDEETIASGSAAAAAGGFTAVCAMPNTDPVCDNAAVAEMIAGKGAATGLVRVVPAGSITQGLQGSRLSLIGEMARCSARVRLFTDDGKGVADASLLRRAMEYIKGFGGVCAEHCDEASLSQGGQMHEGEFSEMLGLKGVPSAAEEIALSRDIVLAKLTGCAFHALHVSTAGSVELVRRAKAEGMRVTAEATPHHLSLTDADLVEFDPNFKVNPPLRSASDVEAVRAGLADGTIDAIATDHAPHSPEEKEGEFEQAPAGLIGLETALGVIVSQVVDGGILSMFDAIKAMTAAPARILGLQDQGGPVTRGYPANLTVFDPEAVWTVDARDFRSLSRNCPWTGRTLKGRVIHTISSGNLVVNEGRIRAEAVL